ncbi:MAG TPA: hypothetical protein VML55_15125 [Planctomycetaceae bacterium]|nr:hypothetical protein [Planctomycetaceae bacterium]
MLKVTCASSFLLVSLAGCADSARPDAASTTRPPAAAAPGDRDPRNATPHAQLPRPAAPATPVNDAPDASPPAAIDAVQTVYRRSDDRPRHDDAALAERGIHAYESRRLKLYTDIDPDLARPLPAVIDAAYDEWVRYFGPLPPDREGTEYQMTGCIMSDRALFRETGLLPSDLAEFPNGRHWNARFWMHNQPFDYYRRHLMIHEATHCFMTAARSMQGLSPVWYFEGMAELFGTHRIDPDGTIRFRVMPDNPGEVADYVRNLGRIEAIQTAVGERRGKSLVAALNIDRGDFSNNEAYAWSWAVCKLLDAHPAYRERFRRLGEQLTPRAFQYAFSESFDADRSDLGAAWTLFVHGLQHGFDIERASVEFRAGTPLVGAERRQFSVAADRGWQSSGVRVEAGRTYVLVATGRVTLAGAPKPWISEPQGISIRYFRGRPLGQLLASVRSVADEAGGDAASMLDVVPIGRGLELEPPVTGTLYLRVNDSWSELADNQGDFQVEVRAAE